MGRAITRLLGAGILLFAGVWSFVALPALCVSGVLVHACDCESSTGCGHETECADDPCASVAPLREETADDQLVSLLVDTPLEPLAVDAAGGGLMPVCDIPMDSFFSRRDVPVFRSDVPFLI